MQVAYFLLLWFGRAQEKCHGLRVGVRERPPQRAQEPV